MSKEQRKEPMGPGMIWKLIKLLFALAILGAIALIAYAYIGPIFMPDDFTAPQEEIHQPIEIDLGE